MCRDREEYIKDVAFKLFTDFFLSFVKLEAGYVREVWKDSLEEDGDAAGFLLIKMAGSIIIRKTTTRCLEGT